MLIYILIIILLICLCKNHIDGFGMGGQLILPRLEQSIIYPGSSFYNPSLCKNDPEWTKGDLTCMDFSLENANCDDIGDNGSSALESCQISCDSCKNDTQMYRRENKMLERLPSPVSEVDINLESYGIVGDMGDDISNSYAGLYSELEDKIDVLTDEIENMNNLSSLSDTETCNRQDIDDGYRPSECSSKLSGDFTFGQPEMEKYYPIVCGTQLQITAESDTKLYYNSSTATFATKSSGEYFDYEGTCYNSDDEIQEDVKIRSDCNGDYQWRREGSPHSEYTCSGDEGVSYSDGVSEQDSNMPGSNPPGSNPSAPRSPVSNEGGRRVITVKFKPSILYDPLFMDPSRDCIDRAGEFSQCTSMTMPDTPCDNSIDCCPMGDYFSKETLPSRYGNGNGRPTYYDDQYVDSTMFNMMIDKCGNYGGIEPNLNVAIRNSLGDAVKTVAVDPNLSITIEEILRCPPITDGQPCSFNNANTELTYKIEIPDVVTSDSDPYNLIDAQKNLFKKVILSALNFIARL